MKPSFSSRVLTADDRLVVRARLGLCAVLIVLAPLLFYFPDGSDELVLYLGLLAVFCAVTAAQWVDVRRDGRLDPTGLMYALVPDIAVMAGMTYLFAGYGDAFYPVVMLLPVGYALVVSRRQALIAAVASSVAYVAGQSLVVPIAAVDLLLLVIKAAGVPLLVALVSAGVRKRDRRGEGAAQDAAENRALSEQLQRDVAGLRAVARITDIVHASLDLEAVNTEVLSVLAQVIGVGSCGLMVVDKERSETLFSANLGDVATPAVAGGDDWETARVDEAFSCISVYQNPRAAVLFCARDEDLERLEENDRFVLTAVASELVVGVENSRLYHLTRRMAITDELTDLYNYRYLQQRLDEEIERARRYSGHLSLLMIDADDFKGYNDAYGHVAGDVALGELARVLVSAVREVDLVARYGGEEFSIVLPQTDAAGAFVVAEKVRESVRNHEFSDPTATGGRSLTVSIGLATYPTHAADKDSLLREADDALYRAKNGGKNRVRTPRRTAEENDVASAAMGGPSPGEGAAESDEWTGD